jgi:sugar (pentulose or hexulose) kinase
MRDRGVLVIDIGKTNAKLTLIRPDGSVIARISRTNGVRFLGGLKLLDTDGVERWLETQIPRLSRLGSVDWIVPVAHGAGAAIVRGRDILAPAPDYEQTFEAPGYDAARDSFRLTGSPSLPLGLNLGRQLERHGRGEDWPSGAVLVPWPQFWAWRLCGVAASDVSSLGCHTDLWRPFEATWSDLARSRGWAGRIAPVRHAAYALGHAGEGQLIVEGLAADCIVYCGLHDSNAALMSVAACADATDAVLATGTWFVVMRPGPGLKETPASLDEHDDCLVNVDPSGRPVPSARFMGGRLAQRILGCAAEDSEAFAASPQASNALRALVADLALGRSTAPPVEAPARAARAALELAAASDAAAARAGALGSLTVTGRFAHAELFMRTLAALRAPHPVMGAGRDDDVALGALRVLGFQPEIEAPKPAAPADADRDLLRAAARHLAGACPASSQTISMAAHSTRSRSRAT